MQSMYFSILLVYGGMGKDVCFGILSMRDLKQWGHEGSAAGASADLPNSLSSCLTLCVA